MIVDTKALDGFFEDEAHAVRCGRDVSSGFIHITDDEHQQLLEELSQNRRLTYEGGKLSTARQDNSPGAEFELRDRMAQADAVIRPLSDERDAGIISDCDLSRWKAWIVYRKALRELDVSKDEVSWPAKPE